MAALTINVFLQSPPTKLRLVSAVNQVDAFLPEAPRQLVLPTPRGTRPVSILPNERLRISLVPLVVR